MIDREKLADAIAMVDEEYVWDAKACKRPAVRRTRTALIAACLAAALIGTVFAAEMVWGVFTKGTSRADRLDRLELVMEGTANFELDEVLEGLARLAEEREKPAFGRVDAAAFDSWEIASEYIGVPLASNSLLAQYPTKEVLAGPTRDDAGNPVFLCVSGWYVVEDVTVSVDAYLRTSHAEEESLYTLGISYDPGAMTVEDSACQMPDGSPAVIVQSSDGYYGAFVRDGVLYWVTVYGSREADDAMGALLRQIMAAY